MNFEILVFYNLVFPLDKSSFCYSMCKRILHSKCSFVYFVSELHPLFATWRNKKKIKIFNLLLVYHRKNLSFHFCCVLASDLIFKARENKCVDRKMNWCELGRIFDMRCVYKVFLQNKWSVNVRNETMLPLRNTQRFFYLF